MICLASIAITLVALGLPATAAPSRTFRLGDVAPILFSQGWGQLQIDKSVSGKPLQIADRTFTHGLGTHSPGEIFYDLEGSYDRFESWVGMDAAMKDYPQASLVFKVLVDGRVCFDSGPMRVADKPKRVSVPLTGASELRLVVADNGDGSDCDHADWADPVLIGRPSVRFVPKPKYSLKGPGLALAFSEKGGIAGARLGSARLPVDLGSVVKFLGCRESAKTSIRRLPGGGLEFAREMTRIGSRDRCRILERFSPTASSIRWEVEIKGTGENWSTPVSLRLYWPNPTAARFWAPWDDPDMDSSTWHDPLVSRPFANKTMWIGAPPMGPNPQGGLVHFGGDCVSIPMATVLLPTNDLGLSLVLSPEDTYLDTSLTTTADGVITLSHIGHRIGSKQSVKFTADLVVHPADWRGGLGWMVRRYPAFFDPPNPRADQLAGCGAYSSYEGDLDAAKYRKMAFKVNWKASFDFPYCGMFIPPVEDDKTLWPRFDADSAGGPNGATTFTSIAQLEGYSRKMRSMGFEVLNFFNVTEVGTQLRGHSAPDMKPGDPDLWRNPKAWIDAELPDAILTNESGNRCGSWGNQIVVDPAAPQFRKHIMEQARRHVAKIPSSAGICIDRMDWVRPYNPNADDGVSWRSGKPMRALTESWKTLMGEMGPMMHHSGKVIFANALVKRLDLARHLDGIYHEFGHLGTNLNGTALLCVRKPAMAWTPPLGSEKELAPDPDSYFQRHLHMGVYPTAPLPGNDHTITPSDWADKWYTDYGPLLDVMRGKKWVLEPYVIQVARDAAKANLFEVPGGYVVPVTFGGSAASVELILRKPKGLANWGQPKIEALHPGTDARTKITPRIHGDVMSLTVPLQRGCAMIIVKR